jgi:acetyl-CoA carboxylase carboxyl transferase subunit alpha
MSGVVERVRRHIPGSSEPAILEPNERGERPERTLSAWDRVKLARHNERPHAMEYLAELTTDLVELHGDRSFGDDAAIVGGLAQLGGRTVPRPRPPEGPRHPREHRPQLRHGRPEGYRKAERLMRHAEKFGIPVVSLIDTPGAEPGHRLRGARAGDRHRREPAHHVRPRTPTVAVVIGEGGSGGALAIGMADRMLMLENAVYAVASPEACAAILWKDSARAPEAAATMRVTADDLYGFGLMDEIVPEPVPAHERPRDVIRATGEVVRRHLAELTALVEESGGMDRLIAAETRSSAGSASGSTSSRPPTA